jgi:hypothetical protein
MDGNRIPFFYLYFIPPEQVCNYVITKIGSDQDQGTFILSLISCFAVPYENEIPPTPLASVSGVVYKAYSYDMPE